MNFRTSFHSTFLLVLIFANLTSCQLMDDNFTVKGIALVYAGSQYSYAIPNGINSLEGTRSDGEVMAVILQNAGYEVYLRLDDGLSTFTPRSDPIPASHKGPATKVQILADFEMARTKLTSGDNFVFYFAGHGGRVIDYTSTSTPPSGYDPTLANENLYSNPYDEYLMLYGLRLNQDMTHWIDNTLSDNELASYLNALPTVNPRLVIIDACNSGGFLGLSKEGRLTPRAAVDSPAPSEADPWASFFNYNPLSADIVPSNALILTAAGERELSYERTIDLIDANPLPSSIVESKHGVFTYYLIRGITQSSADLNSDGFITLGEAWSYTRQSLINEHNIKFTSSAFLPQISGGSLDFILVNSL